MKVFVTDPVDPHLSIESKVLGDSLITAPENPNDVHVAIVHQTHVNEDFLSRFANLRGVVRQGVGVDKVDLKACAGRGILVSNVPDYCTSEVADTAMAMILDLVRGVSEVAGQLRQHPLVWQSLALPRVRKTSNLTLGIIGAGRIGSSVIRRACPFGFRLIYFDPAVDACPAAERVTDLETLLSESDIVSLHIPEDEMTAGLVDAHFIEGMKQGAMLVNTARGKLLGDEAALLTAVRERKLSAVALDVLPSEPPVDSVLFEAWRNEDPDVVGRILINPHVAFHSSEASLEVRRRATEEAARILLGEEPIHGVR